MAKRGRKSAAEHQIAALTSGVTAAKRIAPRADAPAAVRKVISELVNAVDADHFRPSDWPLLESYARAILLERQAYTELEADGLVVGGRHRIWLTVAEKAGRQIVACSARLRLAPQSRIDPKTVGRRDRNAGAVKPWDMAAA